MGKFGIVIISILIIWNKRKTTSPILCLIFWVYFIKKLDDFLDNCLQNFFSILFISLPFI